MIRIVMAEDQGLLASALKTLLSLEEDIQVVGEASDGETALSLIKALQPDICLLDIEMPMMTGLEVAENIQDFPCKVMILTTFAKDGYFERAVNAQVDAYLLKDTPSDELIENIRGVLNGRKYYSPELITKQFVAEKNPLTEREQEILLLVGKGASSKEISQALFLSEGTVRNYLSEILSKLAAKNRIEAFAIAEGKGWL